MKSAVLQSCSYDTSNQSKYHCQKLRLQLRCHITLFWCYFQVPNCTKFKIFRPPPKIPQGELTALPRDLLAGGDGATFKSQNAPNSKFSGLHPSLHWGSSLCSPICSRWRDGAIFKSQNASNSNFFGPAGGSSHSPDILAGGDKARCPLPQQKTLTRFPSFGSLTQRTAYPHFIPWCHLWPNTINKECMQPCELCTEF